MTTNDGYDNQDPSGTDYLDQIRQRVMQGLQGAEPTAPVAEAQATVSPDTPSPDYAPVTSPEYGSASPASSAPTSPAVSREPNVAAPGNDYNAVAGYYSSFTGDHGGNGVTPAEINGWLSSGLSLGEIQNKIANSDEAQAFAARRTAAPKLGDAAVSLSAPTAAAAGGGSSAAVSGTASNPFNEQIRAMILDWLTKAGQPVDENSPEIQATLSAARDEAQRSQTQERNALAERLYAQNATGGGGLNTNALTSQIQQSSEKNAGALAGLRANVLMSVYNSRRGQLENLLQLAVQTGDAESARSLQAQIANLQAAVQREGLGVNLSEFGAQLNQNAVLAGLR